MANAVPTPGPYTVARFADDLAAELRRLPDVRYILVGHSLGGAVCAEVARALPDRVSHVLAVESLLHPILCPRLSKHTLWLYRQALTYAFKPLMRVMLRGSHTAGTPQWVKDEAAEDCSVCDGQWPSTPSCP
jgi:pimeloyl-ACP methyl ester carboxylesterase